MHSDSATQVQTLWDFLFINDPLKPSECIVVLGSNDIRSAEYAVTLFKQQLSPKIIFSGGFGRLTHSDWRSSEAEVFAQRAYELGVPEDRIYIENKSTNTAENILFTQDLITMHSLICNSLIVITKPYMTRRAKAIIDKQSQWHNVLMSAPQIPCSQYPNQDISFETMVNIMVGELDRLIKYPANGFLDSQQIPPQVIAAYEHLKHQGYTQSLVND